MPLPTPELLEMVYEGDELRVLLEGFAMLRHVPHDRREDAGREMVSKLWPDELTRLQKTTWIVKKDQPPGLMTLNYAQRRFWNDVVVRCRTERSPIRGIILKARQLGFSTMIQALHHYWCYWNPHRYSMTVSYDDESTEELFQKARYIDEQLWFDRPKARARRNTLQFREPHGSTFYTRTAGNLSAGRGLTLQHLHCSEIPMWPDAETVLIGLQQALAKTLYSTLFWESTARGAVGVFYDGWNDAVAGGNAFVPFFAPWFWDSKYSKSFRDGDYEKRFMRSLTHSEREYMSRYGLSAEQMHWRRDTIDNELSGREMAFRQEYPACAQEAFLTTGSPVFDPDRILQMGFNTTPPSFVGHVFMVMQEA